MSRITKKKESRITKKKEGNNQMYRVAGILFFVSLFIFNDGKNGIALEKVAAFENVEQLAAELDATIQKLGSHVVLYSVFRPTCKGDDCESGYVGFKKLMVDGGGVGEGALRFREAVNQSDDEFRLISQPMWVFDGEKTIGYSLDNNTGTIWQGSGNRLTFQEPNDVRRLYREILGFYLPGLLRGEITIEPLLEVQDFRTLDSHQYQVVLEAKREIEDIIIARRYIVVFDANRGALPISILWQQGALEEGNSQLIWSNYMETQIEEWIEVDDGLFFPKRAIVSYSYLNVPNTNIEVLAFEQRDQEEINSIVQQFQLPDNCLYFNATERTYHRAGSDMPVEEGIVTIDKDEVESFFTYAFGMTREDALEHFHAIGSFGE